VSKCIDFQWLDKTKPGLTKVPQSVEWRVVSFGAVWVGGIENEASSAGGRRKVSKCVDFQWLDKTKPRLPKVTKSVAWWVVLFWGAAWLARLKKRSQGFWNVSKSVEFNLLLPS